MKERKRKTCKRTQIQSVKGKNCGGISGQADPAPTVTPSATSLLSSLVPLKQRDNSNAGQTCPFNDERLTNNEFACKSTARAAVSHRKHGVSRALRDANSECCQIRFDNMSSDKSQAAQRQLCPAGRDKRVLSTMWHEQRTGVTCSICAGGFCYFLTTKS